MKLLRHPYKKEEDYWQIRNFLREVFLLNSRLEHSWHVARLDYWRWHFILNCLSCGPVERVTSIWESADGDIAAVLHPISQNEIRLHVHPGYRTGELEGEIFATAEKRLSAWSEGEISNLYVPIFEDDTLRKEVLTRMGYERRPGWGHHWRRDLDTHVPEASLPQGYTIRSMGDINEHPSRSWASWRAFHADEGDENYDGDWSWYQNIQASPLYRRDLDIVSVAEGGDIASFCTIYYDDYTRSAVCVLVGTAAEHWRRGLGKAVILEGMRRLQALGCTRVFATAHDTAADALYGSVMQTHLATETWLKVLTR